MNYLFTFTILLFFITLLSMTACIDDKEALTICEKTNSIAVCAHTII